MRRTLIALLAGALLASWGACSDKKSSDRSSESAIKGKRGTYGMKGKRGGPAMRAGRLQERLGLSDEQTAKLEAALAEATSREGQMKALAEILTPEQHAQYEDMMAGRGGRRGPKESRDALGPAKRRGRPGPGPMPGDGAAPVEGKTPAVPPPSE